MALGDARGQNCLVDPNGSLLHRPRLLAPQCLEKSYGQDAVLKCQKLCPVGSSLMDRLAFPRLWVAIAQHTAAGCPIAYYQENPETLAEAESLATPDELSMDASTPGTKKSKIDKNAPPKARRVRTVNGTPGKGLLTPATLLPEAVQEEKEKADGIPAPAQSQQLPRPKASRIKKMPVASSATETKLPSLDVAPVGVTATATPSRKSRLAAPKKVVMPQTATAASSTGLLNGKENTQRSAISDATPKKGIPAPNVVIPAKVATSASTGVVGVESGLPRRRGRKY